MEVRREFTRRWYFYQTGSRAGLTPFGGPNSLIHVTGPAAVCLDARLATRPLTPVPRAPFGVRLARFASILSRPCCLRLRLFASGCTYLPAGRSAACWVGCLLLCEATSLRRTSRRACQPRPRQRLNTTIFPQKRRSETGRTPFTGEASRPACAPRRRRVGPSARKRADLHARDRPLRFNGRRPAISSSFPGRRPWQPWRCGTSAPSWPES